MQQTLPRDSSTAAAAVERSIRAALFGRRAYVRLELITSTVSKVTTVSLEQMKSSRSVRHFNEARRLVCAIARKYAPDLSTATLALYLNKSPKIVTRMLRVSYRIRHHDEERRVVQGIERIMYTALVRVAQSQHA